MRLLLPWILLLVGGCAPQQHPTDPFWAEVDSHRLRAPLSAEYEAQVGCLTATVVLIWQCDDHGCQAVYDCPNRQR